jgi:hypothetical protein
MGASRQRGPRRARTRRTSLIINPLSAQRPAERRYRAGRPLHHVSTGCARGLAREPGCMRQLVADEGSTAPAPFDVEKVHETSP